jgi:AraC-like DNA-binding protein
MTAILVFTILFSLIMAGIALGNSRQNAKVHLSFMALMLCLFLLLTELAMIQWEMSTINLVWFCVSAPATIAIPACFYLYFRSSLRLESEFVLKDGLHFILPAIYAIMMIPYYILSIDDKMAMMISFLNHEPLSWQLRLTPTREIRMGLVTILGAFYVQRCWHELHHESNHKKADVLREVNRFRWTILVMAAAFSCSLIFFMVRIPFEQTWAITTMVGMLVLSLGLLYWRLPQWGHHWWVHAKDTAVVADATFSAEAEQSLSKEGQTVDKAEKGPDKEDEKKYRSSVTHEVANSAMQELQTVMQAGLYKDSTLTLRKLAHKLDLSQHHLSQIINEQTQGSYYDLLNLYRINEAKRLLIQGDLSIIDITYEAGFNSKSSFYTEFRRQTNSTPGQFKKIEG